MQQLAENSSASAPTQADTSGIVVESTASKIRTFLYEIAEGTSNYRSLHNLTQQVEHQYHGRFLVELIQNAHDALHREVGPDQGRIEIRLDANDGLHGALYVANDGLPFTESNFMSLSQLGQSDKNPQESIGNKGIGFRSVLEICDSPEIFSRRLASSTTFDGLCFRFTPEVLSMLAAPIEALAQDGQPVKLPFSDSPIVDWDPPLLAKFRRAVARHDQGWLRAERAYLSPYLLPIPITRSVAPPTVSSFEDAGFATLLRLPLKSNEALTLVRKKVQELQENTVLFLERVRVLVLHDGDSRRELTRRAVVNPASSLGEQEIQIACDAGAGEDRYRVWSHTIRVEESSSEFKDAILKLPGKWPELREARVSIAVRVGDEPDVGAFSVFLPTLLRTGSATHVSAPFFADMSRTLIDFEQVYNRVLLQTAWRLAVDVLRSELAGKGEVEARMIVDLLAPLLDDDDAGKRWIRGITTAIQATSAEALADEAWFLSTEGWSPLNQTSLAPPMPHATVFNEMTLREYAAFRLFHACMNSRSGQLERLSRISGFSVYPRKEDLAATAEVVADAIHESGAADWNSFWAELRTLMQDDAELLKKRKILVGRDGRLHATGEDCAVFFAPRRGVGDEDELAGDSAVVEIPPTLQPHVAFLHDSIGLYDENNRQSPTRKFLDDALVKRFRVEDIFSEVLIPRTPKLPVRLKSPEAALCADILRWGLRLLSNLVERGIGDKTIHLLKNLAVPCAGGWYRADSASYGPGWPMTQGDTLKRYLSGSGTSDCRQAAKRLLLPPDRPEWGGGTTGYRHLLDSAGVFDGLRLNVVDPSDWSSTFWGAAGSFTLPEKAPLGIPPPLWEQYRSYVRAQNAPYYVGTFQYQVQAFLILPGLTAHDTHDRPTRAALMDLILASACKWQSSWTKVSCRKMSGSASFVSVRSPLWFALSEIKWLGFGPVDRTEWCAPRERWHVPAKVLGARTWQFEHLHPIPVGTAHRLDSDAPLAAILVDLGMPQYDLEAKSGDIRLLSTLAAAFESEEIRDPNVFLGHVRSAWGTFAPVAGQTFPDKLIVHQHRRLAAVAPAPEKPVYIPNSARSLVSSLDRFEVPVLAIEHEDANRLASSLAAAYGNAIVLTSTLKVVPIVDGEPWEGGQTQHFHDTEINWTIEIALTLAAYAGYQPRGTGAARFAEQIQAFRDAQVFWCATLHARLNAVDQTLEQPDVPAMWMAERKTLLIANQCRERPELLSEALAALLVRDDLVVPMTLALSKIDREPDAETIAQALGALRLTDNQYLEVREHWRGTLGNVTYLLAPLLTILYPDHDINALLAARNEQQVTEFLDSLKIARSETDTLLALTRSVSDAYEFGLACFRKYGTRLELDRWNASLQQLGTRQLKNANAAAEFAIHASRVLPALRSLLAGALRRRSAAESARALIAALESVTCPLTYPVCRWEVQFSDVLAAFAGVFERMGAPEDIVALVRSSESYDALISEMPRLGVDPAFDPLEVVRDNRERVSAAVGQLQEIGLAWAVGISDALATLWESRTDLFMEALDVRLATSGYLTLWSSAELFALLRTLPHDSESLVFWAALDGSKSLDELKLSLGISRDRLVNARKNLADLKERARRQGRMISVCGREFDSSEDNLTALWKHITEELSDSAVGSLDPIDIATPAGLTPPPKRKPSGKGTGGGIRSVPLQKIDENLVGLAGEIHAFRRLQLQHGNMIVSASSWVSSNSLRVYADNIATVNDAAGCDFRFVVDGKTYHVEVKSSTGADELFTLGSSEIRLAMELSRSRRSRQRASFVLLRVLNTLSERPIFQVLPNPYDERFRSYYDIVEAGARIRYRVSVPETPFKL